MPKKPPKMTAARRRKLPAKKMGLPDLGKYPVDTPARARNAKARAAQEFEKGNLSKSQLDDVVRKAEAVIGGSPAKKAARKTAPEIAKAATKRKGATPKVKAGGTAKKPNPAMAKKKVAKKKRPVTYEMDAKERKMARGR